MKLHTIELVHHQLSWFLKLRQLVIFSTKTVTGAWSDIFSRVSPNLCLHDNHFKVVNFKFQFYPVALKSMVGGQSASHDSEKFAKHQEKLGKKRENIGKKRKNQEASRHKAQNSFHFVPPDTQGWLHHCLNDNHFKVVSFTFQFYHWKCFDVNNNVAHTAVAHTYCVSVIMDTIISHVSQISSKQHPCQL